MRRILQSLLLALCLVSHAHAAPDPARHALSLPVLQQYNAAHQALERLGSKRASKEDETDYTVDSLTRAIDADPRAKPILAKYGFTSQSFALTTMAYFQAAFYVGMESSMDKKKAAQLYASYTKETQANIELLRKNMHLLAP